MYACAGPEVVSIGWTSSSTRRLASSTSTRSEALPRPCASSRVRRCGSGPTTRSVACCAASTTCRASRSTCGTSTRRPGPFYVEGAEPGDTLVLHLVSLEPARDWGASAAIPFFGGMTSTDRVVTLQDPLPDTTWIYELDRDRNTVAFAARHSDHPHRASGRADARHRRRRPGRRRGALLAGARPLRRQHGHAPDARRVDGLPRRQRRGRDVLHRRRSLPPGRG